MNLVTSTKDRNTLVIFDEEKDSALKLQKKGNVLEATVAEDGVRRKFVLDGMESIKALRDFSNDVLNSILSERE